MKATYEHLTGVELGDLTGTTSTTASSGASSSCAPARGQIHFGEIERPDDIETLMHHKPLFERLLAKVGA